ncbi:interferon lambda-3-like [Alligator sinensis]|uniref:Interferon lambda-3-like n=1 Tax=Alligator sinensis TaxID=38654 RepID=A0A3Q0GEB2_ALLSI|nr:interferon lambda-3-like [Alligator sinensis]
MLQGNTQSIRLGLFFVMTVCAVFTEAFPRGPLKKHCHLTKYRSLSPSELKAIKNIKDKFEETMPQQGRKCTNIFNRPWEVAELSVRDRVILVQAELDFTIDTLKNIEDPSLSEQLPRPLEFLTHIREDLKSCTFDHHHSHKKSEKLSSWLQKFHEAKSKETRECLEESVILSIFRLLNKDLACAALKDDCIVSP